MKRRRIPWPIVVFIHVGWLPGICYGDRGLAWYCGLSLAALALWWFWPKIAGRP